MRKTITSVAVVGAAGALLAAGGAYSVFNDAGASVGGLTAGTVKLSVTGQVPATDIFALSGPCTTRYQDNTSPTDRLNMGTVNNTGCDSHFTVHNAGSLPFELSGTTVSDTNPVGLTCVTSTITDGINRTAALLPGADRVVTVSTATVSDVAGCQNLTDKVTASLVATETKYVPPGESSSDGFFTVASSFLADNRDPSNGIIYGGSQSPASLTLTLAGGATKTLTTGDAPLQGQLTQGWWNANGHTVGNTNYAAGTYFNNEYRDFFSFATAGIAAHVVSATLNIPNTNYGTPGTESFWGVHTPATTLVASGGPTPALFDDLGTGSSYGTQHVAPSSGTTVSIPLNAAAVGSLNLAAGQ